MDANVRAQIEEKLVELETLEKKSKKTILIMAYAIGIGGALILGIGLSSLLIWRDYMMKEGIIITILGLIVIAISFPAYHISIKNMEKKVQPLKKQMQDVLDA